jgi:hypothetical protein
MTKPQQGARPNDEERAHVAVPMGPTERAPRGGSSLSLGDIMSIWRIPRSSADCWRAMMFTCEVYISVLWLASIVLGVLQPSEAVMDDHQIFKGYLADEARAVAPAVYTTLGVSVMLGCAVLYRRVFAHDKDVLWTATPFVVLGLAWGALVWPHVPLCK